VVGGFNDFTLIFFKLLVVELFLDKNLIFFKKLLTLIQLFLSKVFNKLLSLREYPNIVLVDLLVLCVFNVYLLNDLVVSSLYSDISSAFFSNIRTVD